jgi:hypothetical protein
MSIFPADMLDLTDRLCAESPRYAQIRTTLLALEADGHRAGWDSPVNAPLLFAIEHDRLTGRTQARLLTTVNVLFHAALDQGDGEPGGVLARLAVAFEQAQGALGPVGLHGGPAGVEFYGYAFRSEGWTTPAEPDETARRAVERHELHRYPGRIEIRQVYLAGVDGLTWWVLRHRGSAPQVLAALPESTSWAAAGRIPNALVRMTNALAGSHAPVPEQDTSEITGTDG